MTLNMCAECSSKANTSCCKKIRIRHDRILSIRQISDFEKKVLDSIGFRFGIRHIPKIHRWYFDYPTPPLASQRPIQFDMTTVDRQIVSFCGQWQYCNQSYYQTAKLWPSLSHVVTAAESFLKCKGQCLANVKIGVLPEHCMWMWMCPATNLKSQCCRISINKIRRQHVACAITSHDERQCT